MMTRQDYVKLAHSLSGSYPTGSLTMDERNMRVAVWENVVRDLTDTLENDNPRFDRVRFLRMVREGD
jgi:hypothetical protein